MLLKIRNKEEAKAKRTVTKLVIARTLNLKIALPTLSLKFHRLTTLIIETYPTL